MAQAVLQWVKINRTIGIHGYPKVDWDDVPGGFYCPHNKFRFPTWHRPYMMLYEV
jgi:tyrosinase